MSETILKHPSIGSFRGIKKTPAVTQYLGIQYASLKDRFSRGELLLRPAPDALPSTAILDATTAGPSPLLPPGSYTEYQATTVQRSLPFEEWEQSDTKGLTLNISVPIASTPGQLPVFVFVYGGGFTVGSAEYPDYDLARITEMSAEIGSPMVSVALNYRTGVPGFLYSSAMKEQGYKPNNGLDDQRLALRWVKHNISGFGGDPNRVTFVGESAGAVSGWFHLQSSEPLFHQLVALSGSSFVRPRPLALLEKGFKQAATELGAGDASPIQQVRRLLEVPAYELMATLGRKTPVGPFVDGDLIRTSSTFEEILDKEHDLIDFFPALKHCRRVVMGDCQMDGIGFYSRVRWRTDLLPQFLAQCLKTVFDPIDTKIAPSIVSAYGLDLEARSNSLQTTKPCLDFAADVAFALPTRYLTKAWADSSVSGTKAYLCHFNCPNPWDGNWKGHATHALDIMFGLQNFREKLSVGQQQCAERLTKDIIAFVNGAEPWPAYETNQKPGAMVYYAPREGDRDESEFVPFANPQKTKRSDALVKLVGESLLDKLAEVSQMFLVGSLHK